MFICLYISSYLHRSIDVVEALCDEPRAKSSKSVSCLIRTGVFRRGFFALAKESVRLPAAGLAIAHDGCAVASKCGIEERTETHMLQELDFVVLRPGYTVKIESSAQNAPSRSLCHNFDDRL